MLKLLDGRLGRIVLVTCVVVLFVSAALFGLQQRIMAGFGERPDVALCVQVNANGADVATAMGLVRDTLQNKVTQHPNWSQGAYRGKAVRVDAGCTGKPYLLEPGAKHPVLFGGNRPNVITKPSPYQAFIVVLPDEEIARIFRGTKVRVAPQEMICLEHNCREVTAALYLSPSELKNPAQLEDGVLRVLGVIQPYDTGTPPASKGRD